MERKDVIKRVIIDTVIIGIGGVILLIFRFHGKPYKRGFFCDDETLNHPFIESTVPSSVLYVIGFVGGAIMMAVIEMMRYYENMTSPAILYRDTKQICPGNKWITIIRDIYISFVPFCFGTVIEHLLTDIGKYGIGRLRPHFFSVCNIDFTKVNCSGGYIEDFTCNNEDSDKIREVRLSFPSGHSSFSSYIAVYLIIYLQMKLTFISNSLIRPFIQIVIVALAWFTCLSRISDYKHHPGDVAGGIAVGTLSAVLVACCVSDLSSGRRKRTTMNTQTSLVEQPESRIDIHSAQM